MATFVIVHGGWGGGWEWREVARILSRSSHEVLTPTLTGLGDRSHLASPAIGLETHVEDVVETIGWHRVDDVVLVGHSYGGFVATVASSRIPDRLAALVYVDAFVPRDGESIVDLVDPAWAGPMILEPAETVGDGWRVPFPFPDDLGDVEPDVAERYRGSWHPLATYTEAAKIEPRIDAVRRWFVHCVRKEPGNDAFVAAERRAREAGWPVLEIESGHDVQFEDPRGIARILERIAGEVSPTP